jgi:hypothetical protein
MMPNLYLSEKGVQAHHEDLFREAEQQRRVSQLPKPNRSRHALASLIGVVLGAREASDALCETLSRCARQVGGVLLLFL